MTRIASGVIIFKFLPITGIASGVLVLQTPSQCRVTENKRWGFLGGAGRPKIPT